MLICRINLVDDKNRTDGRIRMFFDCIIRAFIFLQIE